MFDEKETENLIPEKVLEVIQNDKPGLFDFDLNRFISKKLLVWIVSIILLTVDKITSDQWISISLGYIGVQSVVDLATAWKNGGK